MLSSLRTGVALRILESIFANSRQENSPAFSSSIIFLTHSHYSHLKNAIHTSTKTKSCLCQKVLPKYIRSAHFHFPRHAKNPVFSSFFRLRFIFRRCEIWLKKKKSQPISMVWKMLTFLLCVWEKVHDLQCMSHFVINWTWQNWERLSLLLPLFQEKKLVWAVHSRCERTNSEGETENEKLREREKVEFECWSHNIFGIKSLKQFVVTQLFLVVARCTSMCTIVEI